MKCFYHKDSDGKAAAYWVRRSIDDKVDRAACCRPEEFFPITYGDPFPWQSIEKDELVWIVDYSIDPGAMARLLTITTNVIWIDHHRTAIDKYDSWDGPEIDGVRVDGIAACMLTYLYTRRLRGGSIDLDDCRLAPKWLRLIADYDTWTFRYKEDTRCFETAFGAYDFSPCSELWSEFEGFHSNDAVNDFINEGRAMLRWRDSWARSVMKLGWEMEWEGHRCFLCNLPRCNSDFFKSMNGNGYDILVPFYYDGQRDMWSVSLYSSKVDVQAIAKRYGGGGHRGAAGFQTAKLPFAAVKEDEGR